MKYLSCLFLLFFATISNAQAPHGHSHPALRAIDFPDVPGYMTLVCDFHQHTVFSDGSVWPDIRVQEALRDSVDAISLTEHLEYQPHKDDLPHPDRNRAFEIAEKNARPYGLIVVNGAEITRDMPPGHSNAIFLKDANKLLHDDPMDVFAEAKKQGAFTFWNHPNWIAQRKDGTATLTGMHRQLLAEGLLNGIEVVNDLTYSDEALQIALDHNLTIMGTSDIHGLVDWQFKIPEGGHRPVTLVFAKERTAGSIKEALFDRRTAVWYNNTLIGRKEQVLPLLEASISVEKASYQEDSPVAYVTLRNDSDANYILENLSSYTLHEHPGIVELPAHASTTIYVKTLELLAEFELKFKVWNAVTAPGEHPDISLKVNL
ncbi:MAG: Sb-PDE family phosphodiesterase [Saprospiraceae bacterium]